MRNVEVRPSTSIEIKVSSTRAWVVCHPKGMTSTGSGNAPRVSTSLPISAITTIWSDAVATIFSCSRAPPPPLIRFSSPSNSSAPSMVRSNHFASSRLMTSMPTSRASCAVRVEVGTPLIRNPSSRTISPKQRTSQAAVDPVPSPTRIPSSTNCAARLAATNFALSIGDNSPAIVATPR